MQHAGYSEGDMHVLCMKWPYSSAMHVPALLHAYGMCMTMKIDT